MKNEIICTTMIKHTLNNSINLVILTAHSTTNKKRYLQDFIIQINNKSLTKDYIESTIFKEELGQFDKGDIRNKYCKIKERKIDNQIVKSLQIVCGNKKYFLSRSESRAAYQLLSMSLSGFS